MQDKGWVPQWSQDTKVSTWASQGQGSSRGQVGGWIAQV